MFNNGSETHISTTDADASVVAPLITRLAMPHLEMPPGALTETPSEHARVDIDANIEARARLLADANIAHWRAGLISAQGEREVAEFRHDEAKHSLADVTERLHNSDPAHYLRLALSLLFGVLALLGEYALTWSTLPALLMIERESLLGIALGGIPVAAAKVLELPIARVFQFLSMWSKSARLWVQAIALTTELLLISGIIGANYIMISSLAPAREEAAKIMRNLESDDGADSKVNDDIAYQAILAVSLVVVLDAAMFFLLIDREFEVLTKRRRLVREQKQCRRELKNAETSFRATREIERKRAFIWETREERSQAVAQAMISRERFLISQIPEKRESPKKLEELIDETLSIVQPAVSRRDTGWPQAAANVH